MIWYFTPLIYSHRKTHLLHFNSFIDGMEENTNYVMLKKMKKLMHILCSLAVVLSMVSCGTIGMVGLVYTGDTQPVAVTSNQVGYKVGVSSCVSVLGIVAAGDGGINAAAKNGNITKISHVDRKTVSVLGVFTSYKFYVYGE